MGPSKHIFFVTQGFAVQGQNSFGLEFNDGTMADMSQYLRCKLGAASQKLDQSSKTSL